MSIKENLNFLIAVNKMGPKEALKVVAEERANQHQRFFRSTGIPREILGCVISQDAECSYRYANEFIKGRFNLGEDVISQNAQYSYHYARDVIMGPWEKGEDAISQDAEYSYAYARNVIKDRWEKGEDAISQNAEYSY